MTEWTPGPFFVLGEDEVDGVPVIEVFGGVLGTSSYKQIAYVQPTHEAEDFLLTDEDKANATLIAAAPDLAEELKRLVYEVDGCIRAFEMEMRLAIGNTNYNALELRVKSSNAALAKAKS